MTKAICLLSGGLDSATTLAIARSQGFEPHALTFLYGQKALAEVEAAAKICRSLGVSHHKILHLALDEIGGSALTGPDPVPLIEPQPGHIPSTYVPARNTILLSYALAYAEVSGSRDIFIGINAMDYSGYPDCRPEYLQEFEKLANLATKAGVEGEPFHLHAPLLYLTKAQIIRRGVELGVDFALTVSCYQQSGDGPACGLCESCRIRLKGFKEAGLADPVRYANLP